MPKTPVPDVYQRRSASAFATLSSNLRLLSDPTRLAIVKHISLSGEIRPSDLAVKVGIDRRRVSTQLAYLRIAGLLESRQEGQSVYYSIVPEAFESLASKIHGFAANALNDRPQPESKP